MIRVALHGQALSILIKIYLNAVHVDWLIHSAAARNVQEFAIKDMIVSWKEPPQLPIAIAGKNVDADQQ